MPRRGGPKHHPDTRDRTRAAEALRLRLSGMTWEEIAAQLNYRGPGGPRMAVERMLSRIEVEGAAQLRATEARRLDELLRAVWPKATAGDCDAIRTVLRISERRSKLLGLDAPAGIAVQGISEREFAEQAAELLKVTGVTPLVELAAPVLTPVARAALYVEPPQETYDPDWSNIANPYDDEPAAGTATHPATESPSPDEPAAEGDDRGDDAEEVEEVEEVEAEIVAEVVPLPTQRTIPASEVLVPAGDGTFIPATRRGIVRRFGGGGYSALAHWRP